MATAASEIQPESNRLIRLITDFKEQGIYIVIVSVCLIVTLASVLLSVLAMNAANRADLRTEMQNAQIQTLRDEVAVLEVRVMNAENQP